jgi:hypothetical protein
MIFQHTWQKVLSGQKTQTRRPARDMDRLWTCETKPEKVLWRGNKVKWRTGQSYAVQQGRNKKAIARIRLLDIRYQLLGNVSEEEGRAEGFSGLESSSKPGPGYTNAIILSSQSGLWNSG